MNLDDTDAAMIAAGHAGDHVALLALADKKQEEGHEDFAHLLRLGVTNGSVETGTHDVRVQSEAVRYLPGYDNSNGGQPRGRMRFFMGDNTSLQVNVPIHHPDYRDIMASHAGPDSRYAPHTSYWQGRVPVPIETADQLDRLRAYHDHPPMRPTPLAIHHGPNGIMLVTEGPSGHFLISRHNGTGFQLSGGIGPHADFDTANAEAARLSGKPAASVSETATQYARAVHTLQRGRQ